MLSRLIGIGSRDVLGAIEHLESRQLLSVDVLNPVADAVVPINAAPTVISLSGRYDAPNITGSIVTMETVLGVINVEMEDVRTPATVANFSHYIDAGRYEDLIFHRSVDNFVIQSGGFIRPALDFDPPREIGTFDPVVNEPGISNLRGTIAMAKQANNPNSATSQWFFNLGNNASNLDNQNGGFTVFGHVIKGLDVMDAIAAVPTFVFDDPFGELPLRNFQNGEGVERDDYIWLNVRHGTEITYTVTSSNPGLVAASLSGTDVTLTYAAGQEGGSTVTIRATAADGTFVDDSFDVVVGGRPTVASVNATPASPVRLGTSFDLNAQGVVSVVSTIARVEFYRDADGNGALDPLVDTLMGSDSSAEGGYSLAVPEASRPLGANTYFARAVDVAGISGPAAMTSMTVFAGTVISEFAASPGTTNRLSPLALTARGFDAGTGTTKLVEFYADTNGDGQFNPSTDKLVGKSGNVKSSAVTVMASGKSLGIGTTRFFVRAQDNVGIYGEALTTTVVTTNVAPSVASLRTSAATIARPGQSVTLSLYKPTDADGKVVRVEYYRDAGTTPDGVLDPATDTLIASTTSAGGGFKIRVDTTGFPRGVVRFFARAFDNEGGVSSTVSVVTYVNAAPTIGAFTSTPASGPVSQTFSLQASSVLDTDGAVRKVVLFLDVNNDGIIDGRDKSLGSARLSGNTWFFSLYGRKLGAGQYRIVARAEDNLHEVSADASTTITIG